MRLNHEQASCYYIDGITRSFNVHREAGKACFFHSAQRFDWVVTDLLLQSESEGGKVVNSERRTWVTIYITLKWDPDHVFLSVRLHDQLMDTQKLTGFLFHCSKSHLFRVFWGFPLCFLAWLHFRGEAKVLSVVFFSHLPHFLGVSVSFIWDFSSLFKKKIPAWSPALLCVHQPFLSPCSPFPPIFLRSSSPRVSFLGYALLTHCDPPALWTPRLPTGNHMLPQHSSGKLLDLHCGQTLSHKYWDFPP